LDKLYNNKEWQTVVQRVFSLTAKDRKNENTVKYIQHIYTMCGMGWSGIGFVNLFGGGLSFPMTNSNCDMKRFDHTPASGMGKWSATCNF
jgi:hypothetical protein